MNKLEMDSDDDFMNTPNRLMPNLREQVQEEEIFNSELN